MERDLSDNIFEIINSAPADRQTWLKANTGGKNIKRRAYKKAKMHLNAFTRGGQSNWLIMPGLRGIGKTTILSQLYLEAPANGNRKFYVSLERIKLIGGSISDVLDGIEDSIGDKIDNITDPLFLFFDEVQFLQDWGLALKTVYDRSPNVFIVCTGSSAIALQTNPDIARRSLKIPIHPLCFTEYVMIRQSHDDGRLTYPELGLAKQIRTALFDSSSEREVLTRLEALRPQVANYWAQLPHYSEYLYDYIKFGTLPFTLLEPENVIRYQQINSLLNESLTRDIDTTERFDASTRDLFPRLLFLLASSDTISHNKLAETLNLNVRTVVSMLETLEDTAILNGIQPRGSAYKKISQPTKYLFTSPAMRAALCTSGGALEEERAGALRGRLVEDMAGLYLKRILHPDETPAILEYDHSSRGADFVISKDGTAARAIALEVGVKKETAVQTFTTLERTGGKYGLVVSGSALSIDTSKKSVFVPFNYFLLI